MPSAMGWALLLALVGSDFGEVSSVAQEELHHWTWSYDSENESNVEVPAWRKKQFCKLDDTDSVFQIFFFTALNSYI